jgi:uncharacterized damage-inducible protein DinB
MTTPADEFIRQSRTYLMDDFRPRIRTCLAALSDEDIWWRPNEASNSIGNLVLHLCGNARQWIVAGVGRADDVRRRQEEFDRRETVSREELVSTLESTLTLVDQSLARVLTSKLLEPRLIQGYHTTVQGAIYHVVEHFAMHTGQIILLTKARTGRGLGFYAVQDGVAKPTWGK